MTVIEQVLALLGGSAAVTVIVGAIAHAVRVRSDAAKVGADTAKIDAETQAQRERTDHALVAALIARVEAAEARATALEARCFALESERNTIRIELDECERRSDAMRIEIRDLYQVIQSVIPTHGA